MSITIYIQKHTCSNEQKKTQQNYCKSLTEIRYNYGVMAIGYYDANECFLYRNCTIVFSWNRIGLVIKLTKLNETNSI